jgi:hypothetical protein
MEVFISWALTHLCCKLAQKSTEIITDLLKRLDLLIDLLKRPSIKTRQEDTLVLEPIQGRRLFREKAM